MNKNILTQVEFNSYRPKKDKSCSLNFITSLEVSSEQIKQFHELLDTRGVLYFKSDGSLTQKEIDEIDNVDVEVEGKSKSQRLRNVLYIYWQQNFKASDLNYDFKKFYSDEMERIIQHYKDKLDA